MKKRNKKHNSSKMLQKFTPDLIANTGIYELPGGKSEFISFNNKSYNPQSLMKVYLNTKQLWTVAMVVFKVTSDGFKAVDVEHVQPPEPCLADRIAGSVQEEHNRMRMACDEKEFICAGYIAIPRNEFLSEEAITNLFEKLGVWRDYITNNGYKLAEEL